MKIDDTLYMITHISICWIDLYQIFNRCQHTLNRRHQKIQSWRSHQTWFNLVEDLTQPDLIYLPDVLQMYNRSHTDLIYLPDVLQMSPQTLNRSHTNLVEDLTKPDLIYLPDVLQMSPQTLLTVVTRPVTKLTISPEHSADITRPLTDATNAQKTSPDI